MSDDGELALQILRAIMEDDSYVDLDAGSIIAHITLTAEQVALLRSMRPGDGPRRHEEPAPVDQPLIVQVTAGDLFRRGLWEMAATLFQVEGPVEPTDVMVLTEDQARSLGLFTSS